MREGIKGEKKSCMDDHREQREEILWQGGDPKE